MRRIAERFEFLLDQGRKALIPYITAGDPGPGVTVPLMHAMVEAGADIVELGVPFSDPMADGPVIQAACERALAAGATLEHVLEWVAEFRTRDPQTPVVLMGYLNPFEVRGYARFAQEASQAGVDGVLTVDMPPEEGHGFMTALREVDIDPIFLIAPTSTRERIARICEVAQGFVYYVSLKGVTGANTLDMVAVRKKLEEIHDYARTPIGVGFGIKDAVTAAAVSALADAVVVGSAIVRHIEAHSTQPERATAEIGALLRAMRQAMDDRSQREQVA